MTTPIAPYRTDPLAGATLPPPASAAAPRDERPARDLPELPDTSAAAVARAVQTARAAGPHPLLAMGVPLDAANAVATPMQQRLDAFQQRATPTFQTREGDVTVPIPFRMVMSSAFRNDPANQASEFVRNEQVVERNQGEVARVGASVGVDASLVVLGRGTPEQVARVTQELINDGRLPPGQSADLAARVRTMMTQYGIGLDCAGYVQQAFLASRGIDRETASLRAAPEENLSGLAMRGFARVQPSSAQPGDLVVLGPPAADKVGHTAIVRSVAPASASDLEELRRRCPAAAGMGPPSLRRMVVDSSWGSGADPRRGGVQSVTWWHDEASGQWISPEDTSASALQLSHFVYGDHPVDGIYRPQGEV